MLPNEKKNPWEKEANKHVDEDFAPEVPILQLKKEATIRLLPSIGVNGSLPFFKYRYHFIEGFEKKYITHDIDERCGICNFANSFFEENEDKYRALKSKIRYDTYCLHDGEIKLLIANAILFPRIITLAEKYGPPEHVNDGYNIVVYVNKKGKYETYTLIADKESTPIVGTIQSKLLTLKPIHCIRKFTTKERIAEIMEDLK